MKPLFFVLGHAFFYLVLSFYVNLSFGMSRVNLFSVLIVDLIFSTPPFRISPAIGLLETRISISKMVNQTNEFRNIPLLPLPLLSASPSARAKSNQFINCLYSTCLLSSALLLASSSHLEFCCVLLLFISNLLDNTNWSAHSS